MLLRNIAPFLHCMTHNETHCAQLWMIFHDRLYEIDSPANETWWWMNLGMQTCTQRLCNNCHITSWMGRVCLLLTDSSEVATSCEAPCTRCLLHAVVWLQGEVRDGLQGEEKKREAVLRRNQLCGERQDTHMLNATYIWYSSIASTNCPHESKSVPFLKLACHFWIVLLTSDMLAGRILAALSGQHSRGGDSSTRLQQQAASSARLSGVQRRTERPATPRPSPFCLLTLISHPQQKGSPAWSFWGARVLGRGVARLNGNRMSDCVDGTVKHCCRKKKKNVKCYLI